MPQRHASYASAAKPTFDPLHLPSLIAFSVSLLVPLKARLGESVRETWLMLNKTKVKVALLGGFCLGAGVCLCSESFCVVIFFVFWFYSFVCLDIYIAMSCTLLLSPHLCTASTSRFLETFIPTSGSYLI